MLYPLLITNFDYTQRFSTFLSESCSRKSEKSKGLRTMPQWSTKFREQIKRHPKIKHKSRTENDPGPIHGIDLHPRIKHINGDLQRVTCGRNPVLSTMRTSRGGSSSSRHIAVVPVLLPCLVYSCFPLICHKLLHAGDNAAIVRECASSGTTSFYRVLVGTRALDRGAHRMC